MTMNSDEVNLADARGDSPLYPGGPTQFEVVAVPKALEHLIGAWEGPFRSHDPQVDEFRPFWSELEYRRDMCVRITGADQDGGDIILVGPKTYTYPVFRPSSGHELPQKIEKGFLIYGMKGGDPEKLFLRTVELDAKTVQYELVYKHEPTGTTVFRNSIPAADGQPPSAVDIVGWNSPTTDDPGTHLLGVSLTIGPMDNPAWQGIVSGGKQYHRPPTEPERPEATYMLAAEEAIRVGVAGAKRPGHSAAVKDLLTRQEARIVLHGMCATIPSD